MNKKINFIKYTCIFLLIGIFMQSCSDDSSNDYEDLSISWIAVNPNTSSVLPYFNTDWENDGAGYEVYIGKDEFNYVHIKGKATHDSGDIDASDSSQALIFTLPEEYRPEIFMLLPICIWQNTGGGGAASGRARIYPTGEVYVNELTNSDYCTVYFVNISFPLD